MNTQCRAKTHCRTTPKRRRRPNDQAQPPQAKQLDLPESHSTYLDFPVLGSRQVLASFDGGDISSDGGGLLLRKTEDLTGIIRQFASCFTDHRNPQLTEHTASSSLPNGSTPWLWATKTSTTTMSCGLIPSWRPLWARKTHRPGPATEMRQGQSPGWQKHPQPSRTNPHRGRRR